MEKYGISQPAVYKILKEKDELLKTFKNSPSAAKTKNSRKANFETLEEDLNTWFLRNKNAGVMLGGPLIKAKAEEIAKKLKIHDFKV